MSAANAAQRATILCLMGTVRRLRRGRHWIFWSKKMTASNTKKTRPSEGVPSEHWEQREFVSWFRKTFPGVRIFAIPNGGARGKAAANRLACEGVSRGVPDCFVPAWGWWIEMKRVKGGTVSKEQKDWHAYLEQCGYTVSVCRGCEAAQDEAKRLYERRQ